MRRALDADELRRLDELARRVRNPEALLDYVVAVENLTRAHLELKHLIEAESPEILDRFHELINDLGLPAEYHRRLVVARGRLRSTMTAIERSKAGEPIIEAAP